METITGKDLKKLYFNEIEGDECGLTGEVNTYSIKKITFTDPIDYSKYSFRPCGSSWPYCTGECDACPNSNIATSDKTKQLSRDHWSTDNTCQSK